MKHLGLVALVILAACKKEPPAACRVYAEKEIACSRSLAPSAHEKVRSSSRRDCNEALEWNPPRYTESVEQMAHDDSMRIGKLRFRHDAACATSSTTCEAYEECKEGFDFAGAVHGKSSR